jgi:hypothetical protein
MGPREQSTEAARLAFDDVVAVLTAHPLIGTEHGNVACGRCHLVLGDPAQHLLAHLNAPEATESAQRPSDVSVDRRESSIGFEGQS